VKQACYPAVGPVFFPRQTRCIGSRFGRRKTQTCSEPSAHPSNRKRNGGSSQSDLAYFPGQVLETALQASCYPEYSTALSKKFRVTDLLGVKGSQVRGAGSKGLKVFQSLILPKKGSLFCRRMAACALATACWRFCPLVKLATI